MSGFHPNFRSPLFILLGLVEAAANCDRENGSSIWGSALGPGLAKRAGNLNFEQDFSGYLLIPFWPGDFSTLYDKVVNSKFVEAG